jgi:uncharacterized protein
MSVSIVVSDTSPIRALQHLGIIWVLGTLYGTVYLPDLVAVELRRANQLCPSLEPADFPFLKIRTPKDQARVKVVRATLDDGEAAALVLAIEMAADFILMDERRGRMVAVQMGLKPVGVLAVLAEAKEKTLLGAVRPLIERLQRELQFRLAPQVISSVLRRVQE